MMYDQVGSLRVIVDSVGTIAKRIDYDSFGNIINDTNPGLQYRLDLREAYMT
jgi:hypothetical protein